MTDNKAFKREVLALAEKAGISYTAARARVIRAQRMKDEGIPHIVCPKCGVASPNINDIAEGYCFNCHDWTGEKK